MQIPGIMLLNYMDRLQFPVSILEEASDRVGMTADRQEFADLAREGRVFGVGSRSKVKRLRLRGPVDSSVLDDHGGSKGGWRAEDSYTFQRQTVEGGQVYRHFAKHCNAWAPPGARPINAGCL